jgi:hypothetical protein
MVLVYGLGISSWCATVITKISSATFHTNGYRNTAMPTSISLPEAMKFIQKEKNYTIG